MATFSKLLLSASTSGKPIVVAGTTAGASTTIHTAVSGATSFDEVWLWASNVTAAAVSLTVQWGGVTDPDNAAFKGFVIPANSSMYPVVTGLVLNGGLLVKAYGSTTAAINITGYVNQIAL